MLTHDRVALDRSGTDALGRLGDALRRPGSEALGDALLVGEPIGRAVLEAHVPASVVDALVAAGLAALDGSQVALAVVVVRVGADLVAIPKQPWSEEVVYLGPDSAHLAEAVLRLAPRGERAAELGTGTGLLAVLLSQRYGVTLAGELVESVTTAAAVTVALNQGPARGRVGVCRSDVAGGFRPGAFDLVAANAPWVPAAPRSGRTASQAFAHGGVTGVELPRRFLLEGARLLRPGGIAITLALDVTIDDGARPLHDVVAELRDEGHLVAVLPTPFNAERPHLLEVVQATQPAITAATHVAVVVIRRRHRDDERRSPLVAVDALARRWASRSAPEATC